MCWALNHQNIIEMAQGHISLSVTVHLFIGTGRSPSKITFMTLNVYLQTTQQTKVYLVFSSSARLEPKLMAASAFSNIASTQGLRLGTFGRRRKRTSVSLCRRVFLS
jgi:hypothetical protein